MCASANTAKSNKAADPRFRGRSPLSASVVPHKDTRAILVQATFETDYQNVQYALHAFDTFSEHVPLLQHGSSIRLDESHWECTLEGRIGIWKFGIPIRMRFVLHQVNEFEFLIQKYIGGTFGDLYFHHLIVPHKSGGGLLKSIYYFDVEDFALIKRISIFRDHPGTTDEIQALAATMMTKGIIELAELNNG